MERALTYRRATSVEDALSFERLLTTCFAVPPEHAGTLIRRAGLDAVRLLAEGPGDASTPAPACLLILDMGQWFGGARVACAGVSAVGVAPERRGRGLGQRLLESMLRELSESHCALSCLYPATRTFYRGLGYEIAGGRYETRVPCSSFVAPRTSLNVEPIASVEDAPMRAVYARLAALSNGRLDRCEPMWQRIGEHRGDRRDGYAVCAPSGEIRGYVWYSRKSSGPPGHDLEVADVAGLDAEAIDALVGFLGTHRSIVGHVSWHGEPSSPLIDRVPEGAGTVTLAHPWMLRIVDVESALRQRGYPFAARGEVCLDVRDVLLEANRGRFVMRVEDGRARVERVGHVESRPSTSVSLDVRDLAAIYSSHQSASSRAAFGTLRGSPRDVATLDLLFAGPAPAMSDMF